MANTFKVKTSRDITSSLASVGTYTVPASTSATVIGLSLANKTSNTVSVSGAHYDGTNTTYLFANVPVVAGGSFVAVGGDQKLVLETGHSFRVSCNTAASVDAIMSILEVA